MEHMEFYEAVVDVEKAARNLRAVIDRLDAMESIRPAAEACGVSPKETAATLSAAGERLRAGAEIADDVVVTYKIGRDELCVGRYGETRAINQTPATNIMPHYSEADVLAWIDAWRSACTADVVKFVQAKMDAYKRGEG